MLEVMGRPLREAFLDDPTPLVVGHPLLAAILKGKQGLFYQHGEIAAPRESWVWGSQRTLVPLSHTADTLIEAGFDAESIFVSGLCIEPAIVSQAEAAFEARLDRLSESDPLCGAFFSSGAEPRKHVESIAAAALSALEAGGRVVVLARESGALAARVSASFGAAERELAVVRSPQDIPQDEARLCVYADRRQLDGFAGALFGTFDYFVAPSHERTNWALGLGLPMFIADPPVGSMSPLNRRFLLSSGVASVIADTRVASEFGESLESLRQTGELSRMAESGWGRYDTRGFANIAGMLASL
jgi:hypothetical protein